MYSCVKFGHMGVLNTLSHILVLSLVTWACSKHYLKIHVKDTHCNDDKLTSTNMQAVVHATPTFLSPLSPSCLLGRSVVRYMMGSR